MHTCIRVYIYLEIYCEELVQGILEAEKSSVSCRLREASGVLQSESKGLRTRKACSETVTTEAPRKMPGEGISEREQASLVPGCG